MNSDGTVDWEEFTSYTLRKCRERDQMKSMGLKPFPRFVRVIPSDHRVSVIRIVIVPYMIGGHTTTMSVANNAKGRYVACDKDGTVTSWSMTMERKSTRKVMSRAFDVVLHVRRGSFCVVLFALLVTVNCCRLAQLRVIPP